MKHLNKKGFTLVELVIVIAVLLILAAIAIPMVSGVIGNANKAKDEAELKSVVTAIKYAQSQNAIDPENPIADVAGALALSGLDTGILTKDEADRFYFDTSADPTKFQVGAGTGDEWDPITAIESLDTFK